MLIFNCTQAAADWLTVTRKGKPISLLEPAPGPDLARDADGFALQTGRRAAISQWVLHAFTARRRHCLVAMSVEDRFCMLFAVLKKGDAQGFLQLFYERLVNHMAWMGRSPQAWTTVSSMRPCSIFCNAIASFISTAAPSAAFRPISTRWCGHSSGMWRNLTACRTTGSRPPILTSR